MQVGKPGIEMNDTHLLEYLLSRTMFDCRRDAMGPMYRLYGQRRYYESKRAALEAALLNHIARRLPDSRRNQPVNTKQ